MLAFGNVSIYTADYGECLSNGLSTRNSYGSDLYVTDFTVGFIPIFFTAQKEQKF